MPPCSTPGPVGSSRIFAGATETPTHARGHAEPRSPGAFSDGGGFGVPKEGKSHPSPVFISCLALTDGAHSGGEPWADRGLGVPWGSLGATPHISALIRSTGKTTAA